MYKPVLPAAPRDTKLLGRVAGGSMTANENARLCSVESCSRLTNPRFNDVLARVRQQKGFVRR